MPVNGDFSLNPEVADLLNITQEEEIVLNDAFQATRLYLAEMEATLATISEERPDKVVVHIPAHGEEGALIREDLLLALEATLGDERFDRFMDVAQHEMESSFVHFGKQAHTIIFEMVYPEDPEAAPLLSIKDGWVEQQGPDRKVVNATQITVPEMPEEYLAYLDWINRYQPGGNASRGF
jgi:hypothetical protein